jgi:hypothetical protein
VISGIKIYKTDGSLKKEISKEKALKLYDEQNKKNWALSPAEKKILENYEKGRCGNSKSKYRKRCGYLLNQIILLSQ